MQCDRNRKVGERAKVKKDLSRDCDKEGASDFPADPEIATIEAMEKIGKSTTALRCSPCATYDSIVHV